MILISAARAHTARRARRTKVLILHRCVDKSRKKKAEKEIRKNEGEKNSI
jgi:hypothetical protein